MLADVVEIPFQPAPESHLLDIHRGHETPAEEFRTLRTRLNHLQTLQPLHTLVVTSPSPAEGKTFTAVNLALSEAHLADNLVLLGDFDLRRPIIHNLFQADRSPGLSDYLMGQVPFSARAAEDRGHQPVHHAGGEPDQEPAGTAEPALGDGAVRGTAAGVQLGHLRYARRCCSRRTRTCWRRWPTVRCWW